MSYLRRSRESYMSKSQHWRKNVPTEVEQAVSQAIDTSDEYRVGHINVAVLGAVCEELNILGYDTVRVIHTLTDLGDPETLSGESVTVIWKRR